MSLKGEKPVVGDDIDESDEYGVEAAGADGAGAEAVVWILLYGGGLIASNLKASLEAAKASLSGTASDIKPIPMRTYDAFLSFDIPGIPYINPAVSGAIVRGHNDLYWKRELLENGMMTGMEGKEGLERRVGSGKEEQRGRQGMRNEGEGHWQMMKDYSETTSIESEGPEKSEEGENYKRWLWLHCSPGLEYTGAQPPYLEGIAVAVSDEKFKQLARGCPAHPSGAVWEFVAIKGHDIRTGAEYGRVWIPVLQISRGWKRGNMRPVAQYIRQILIPALTTTPAPLSREFIGHLTMIRPYEHTTRTRWSARLVALSLSGLWILESTLGFLLDLATPNSHPNSHPNNPNSNPNSNTGNTLDNTGNNRGNPGGNNNTGSNNPTLDNTSSDNSSGNTTPNTTPTNTPTNTPNSNPANTTLNNTDNTTDNNSNKTPKKWIVYGLSVSKQHVARLTWFASVTLQFILRPFVGSGWTQPPSRTVLSRSRDL